MFDLKLQVVESKLYGIKRYIKLIVYYLNGLVMTGITLSKVCAAASKDE